MQDNYSKIGIALGLTGTSVLVVSAIASGNEATLNDGMIAFLACALLSAGARVCVLSFDSKKLKIPDSERLYVFIGGIAIIWVSIDSIWRLLAGIWLQI